MGSGARVGANLAGDGAVVRAVIVDLDDTLYPQSSWLAGACDAVAACAALEGVDEASMRQALSAALADGSDSGRVIDRALELAGASHIDIRPLLAVFGEHAPGRLPTYPGVLEALEYLSARVPIGLVTDGAPAGQQAKLDATGAGAYVSVVVFSDELGREHRKPDPTPFVRALETLGVAPEDAVMVGDRPDKDIEGASRAGMRALRVRTGEFASSPDHPLTWAVADDFPAACRLLRPLLAGRSGELGC
ncbi:MAG: HAD family hydrolase [Acidimicrobiales bacterium]